MTEMIWDYERWCLVYADTYETQYERIERLLKEYGEPTGLDEHPYDTVAMYEEEDLEDID
jgi:hypothetical protein